MLFPFAVLFLALSMVSALVVPRTQQPPKGWLANILEDYDEYHARYLALDCQKKHKSRFFHLCCHPLLKTQSLAARPPQCTPQSGDDDEDCDDGITVPHVTPTPVTTKVATTKAPTTTKTTGDDDEDCDDGDDGIETVTVPHVTSTPVTTKVTTTKAPTTTKTTTTKNTTTIQHPTTTQHPTATQHSTATQHVFSTSTAPTPQKSSSSQSQVFSDGFATFFFQKGNRGACGELHSDNDLIAAIDEQRYGNSGLKSALCGQKVKITNPANKKSVVVTIVDDCPSCNNRDSIDLSVAAFKAIAEESQGMVKIDWSFV